jgi:hypothetical protein
LSVLTTRAKSEAPRALTSSRTPEKLTLLRVMGSVWSFQDPGDGRLYRCEIDSEGNERWLVQDIGVEGEWIYPSEAQNQRTLEIRYCSFCGKQFEFSPSVESRQQSFSLPDLDVFSIIR